MAYGTNFLVVGFARTKMCRLQVEVVMSASSERHAAALGADLAGNERGAIVFSQTDPVRTAEGVPFEIMARFGDVPEDPEIWAALQVPTHDPSVSSHASASRISTYPRATLPTRILPVPATRQGRQRLRSRFSRALASFLAIAVAAFGCAVLAYKASAAQHQARLMEMARQSCHDEKIITDRELHRLVRYASTIGASKHEALHIVIALCQTQPEGWSDNSSLR